MEKLINGGGIAFATKHGNPHLPLETQKEILGILADKGASPSAKAAASHLATKYHMSPQTMSIKRVG